MKIAPLLALLCAVGVSVHGQQNTAPIRLDPHNSHYLEYKGKTIALITSGEHYGSVINSDFDSRTYLKTLQADGLNYTRIFGGS